MEDIEKRLKELEDGVDETDDLLKKQKSKIDPEDLNMPKIEKIQGELGVLGDDTKAMRAKKDELTKDLNDLQRTVDKADPKNVDLDSILDKLHEIGDDTDKLSDDVEEGHDRLKKLKHDLDDALARVLGEKRQDALKKLRDAKNHLDDLQRAIENNNTGLQIADKQSKALNDDYKDKEKGDDLSKLGKKTEGE